MNQLFENLYFPITTKLSTAIYNNPETYFFVSVGSNDIFTNLVNWSKVFDVKPKDTDIVFMDMFGRNKGKVFERHSFYRLWGELMESAVMNRILFTPYCLRSFYITQSILNKFDLLLLAKNCGNSIDTIMKHYEFIKISTMDEIIKNTEEMIIKFDIIL